MHGSEDHSFLKTCSRSYQQVLSDDFKALNATMKEGFFHVSVLVIETKV